MERTSFDLILKEKVFHIPIIFDNIVHIDPSIYKSLIFKHQYIVESNVNESVFVFFIDYLVNQVQPVINSSNFNDYIQLSEEFKFESLYHLIQLTKESKKEYLDINSIKNSYINKISIDENHIACNLDNYLDHYGIEMLKLPIQLLFNIFTNPERKLSKYEYLCELILNYYNETNDFQIFSLLTTFDNSKINDSFIFNRIKEYKKIINNQDFEIFSLSTKIHDLEMKLREKDEMITSYKNEVDKLKKKSDEKNKKLIEIYSNIFSKNEIKTMREFNKRTKEIKNACNIYDVELSLWCTKEEIKYSNLIYRIDKKTNTACFIDTAYEDEKLILPHFIYYNNEKYTVTSIYGGMSNLQTLKSIQFSSDCEITKISFLSFSECLLTEITIIPSITEISEMAFTDCDNLKVVEIPTNSELKSIGKRAFSSTLIEKIFIPKKVIKIGSKAFYDCKNLKVVEIDQNSLLEAIEDGTFSSCAIESFTIPNSVKKIGDSFFGCYKLKKIEISENSELMEIGDSAFNGADIEELFIPKHVKYIGKSAFYRNLNLHKLRFDENSELEIIKEHAFYYCNIQKVSIPVNVIKIGRCAFYSNINLISVNFDINSKLEIIDERSFSSCGIQSLFIPSKVIKIAKEAFMFCRNLTNFEIAEDSNYISIEANVFYDCSIGCIFIPSKIVDLQTGWCNGILNTTEIKLSPNNRRYAFKDNTFLLTEKSDILFARRDIKNVTIPSYIKKISPYSFSKCQFLSEVNFEKNSQLQIIDDYAFSVSPIDNISIPSSVTKIGKYAFSGCKIKNIEFLGDSEYISIGEGAFSEAEFKSISIPSKIIDLQKGWCHGLMKLTSIKISTSNKQYVFKDNTFLLGKIDEKSDIFDTILFARRNIKNVTIPSYIKKISPYSFSKCQFLSTVDFEKNSQLQIIDDYAFYSSSIQKISIPINLKNIGKYSFYDCKSLNNFGIPEKSELETIGPDAFDLSKIKSFYITNNLKQIEYGTFVCDDLIIVEIAEKCTIDVTKINYYFEKMNKEGIIMIPYILSKDKIKIKNYIPESCNIA